MRGKAWRVLRPLLSRLGQAGLVALLVGCIGFALMHALPGDQAFRLAAERYGPDMVDARAAAAMRAELGLDRPLAVQLLEWLGRVLRLDLGRSLVNGEPVIEELRVQIGYTALLAGAALPLSALIGLPLGILAGLWRGRWPDHAVLGLSVLLRAVPAYALGLALMVLLSVRLRWLPPGGFEGWAELVLPSLTLALGLAAVSSRVARESVAAVAASPGLRNAAIPVLAVLGLQLIGLVEGILIVETLFGWPGIGHALVHAIFARDVPLVQGSALIMGLGVVLLNAAVDLACLLIDPRRGRQAA
jgi:ABC-type dipeptide/oligopeptide/nickel transport system permease component